MQFIVIGPLGLMLFLMVWMQIPGKVLAGAFAVVIGIGVLIMIMTTIPHSVPQEATSDPTLKGVGEFAGIFLASIVAVIYGLEKLAKRQDRLLSANRR